MAHMKISEMTVLTAPAAGDYLPIIDITEPDASKNKRITYQNLLGGSGNEDGNVLVWDAVTSTFKPSATNADVVLGKHGTLRGGLKFAFLQTAELGSADWAIVTGAGTFGGHPDELLCFGFNVTTDGTPKRVDATKHALYQVFESYYYVGAAEQYCEWYLEYYSAAGVGSRPISTSVELGSGHIINQFYGNHVFKDDDENLVLQTAGTAIYVYNTIRQQNNNVYFLSQLNAVGNQWLTIFLNDSDRWRIGSTMFVDGDIYFRNPSTVGGETVWYNVIVQDRVSPYTNYRLKVESGILGLEAV